MRDGRRAQCEACVDVIAIRLLVPCRHVLTPLRTCVLGAADLFTDVIVLDHTITVVVHVQPLLDMHTNANCSRPSPPALFVLPGVPYCWFNLLEHSQPQINNSFHMTINIISI